ncbi:diguanylate cyclase [Tamilnaduibacter salinus]|uniref:diguanylate cyclase n=1 Tax=Tamilnaduibacter salinus TaxID=1484056 RepID=A0A2U1CTP7_9GAMM|nr:diguanylate cyclase [Tamilnaduibacter salinus]PVY70080.1 diguanylate cyclase [Tamilnaduibacter salinus]
MKSSALHLPRLALPMLVVLLQAMPTWAATPVPESSSQSLGGIIEVMEDPSHDLTLEQARRSNTWRAHAETVFNKGYGRSAWWLRWSLDNPTGTKLDRILSIDYPLLRDLRLYTRTDGESDWQQRRLGAALPFTERPLDSRYFAVPLSWEPGETRHFYLRVHSDSSLQVPLTISDPTRFNRRNATENILHGIYLGSLLAIGAYNLLLFIAIRDRNYLYYVGVVFSIAMLIATINGYTFRYLWPEATNWNKQAIIVFFGLAVWCAAYFTRRFLRLWKYSRWMSNLAAIIGMCGLGMVALSGIISYYNAIMTLLVITFFAIIYAVFVAIYVWYRGQQAAIYYLLAWSFLLIGFLILVLSNGGFLPSNGLTRSAPMVGSFMEVLLLSFALAQRINIERQLRFAAQQEILDASKRHNRELELRVQERTAELENANHRLNEMSITDRLTGLKNRRYLEEALCREISRANRNELPLSVVMIDLDHFKSLNDTYGHQGGDICLEHVGHILSNSIRDPDIAARYGGEEFALVLTEADSRGALKVLHRVRQALEKTRIVHEGEELVFTLSSGVASRLPDTPLTKDEMIRQADQALYRAKRQGRNQVCVYHSALDGHTDLSAPT